MATNIVLAFIGVLWIAIAIFGQVVKRQAFRTAHEAQQQNAALMRQIFELNRSTLEPYLR